MSGSKNKLAANQSNNRCSYCTRLHECLPRALSALSFNDSDTSHDEHSHIIHAGEHLFYEGEPFEAVYIVRSGSFKAHRDDKQGHETVIALYLGTEVMGLEGIDTGVYTYSAVALETSSYCPITPEQLREFCQTDDEIHNNITLAISREINKEKEHIQTILAHKTAYQQAAAFLINLSARYKRLGYSWQEFRIPLSRWELGSFLGLTVETTSRTLGLLQKNGLIHLQSRIVRILDLPGLKLAAGNSRYDMLSDE